MITFYMEIALLHISLLFSDLARLDIPTFINHKTSNHPTFSISVHTHPAISTRGFLCCETFLEKNALLHSVSNLKLAPFQECVFFIIISIKL